MRTLRDLENEECYNQTFSLRSNADAPQADPSLGVVQGDREASVFLPETRAAPQSGSKGAEDVCSFFSFISYSLCSEAALHVWPGRSLGCARGLVKEGLCWCCLRELCLSALFNLVQEEYSASGVRASPCF